MLPFVVIILLSFFFFSFGVVCVCCVWVLRFFIHLFLFFCMLPSFVFSSLASAPVLGFCGSRSAAPPPAVWSAVVSAVSPSASVSCGCVGGLCGLARSSFPSAVVFRASSFGSGAWSFVARSSALVSSVAASGVGLWVSFPSVACPVGLLPSHVPSRCFAGFGSGSWASLALALGSGVPALLWLPAPLSAPAGWGFVSLGGGWFRA
jgi:hypothetical protein